MQLLNSLEQILGNKTVERLRQRLSQLSNLVDLRNDSEYAIKYLENKNAVLIVCQTKETAFELSKQTTELATIAKEEWLNDIFIGWPGCRRPLQVSALFSNNSQFKHQKNPNSHLVQHPYPNFSFDSHNTELFIPSIELTFPDFLTAERPIYINSFGNRFNPPKVLTANRAAFSCQNRKPSQFLGQSVYELNYPDELDARMERIFKDKTLKDYEYRAYRWRSLESKSVMEFSTDFGLIEYAGEICWFSAPNPNCVRDTGVLVSVK